MLAKIIKFSALSTIFLSGLSANLCEKIYIDNEGLKSSNDSFMIHVGHNMWIETDTVHRDPTGLFTFDSSIKRLNSSKEYQKKWKCPYCYHYWPVGTKCQNADCPSKYNTVVNG